MGIDRGRPLAALALAATMVLGACGDGTTGPDSELAPPDPGLAFGSAGTVDVVVVLKRGADRSEVARSHGITNSYVYRHLFHGMAGTMPAAALSGLQQDDAVQSVELDAEIAASEEQLDPPWGLDRVDQRTASLDNDYTYVQDGTGIDAYIVDTGLRYSHNDFEGRTRFGYDAFGEDGSDCNGHGTHVAGTAGGQMYGVAKDLTLWSVRVLNCDGIGTLSGVIAGLDWIRGNRAPPGVVNMSLGGGASSTLDQAVQEVINAGFFVAVAAGNSSESACQTSPARVADALTVAASTTTDSRASFSNYGSCVDIFAPGVSIESAWYTGDAASAVLSGTSMASPHAAGAAGLILEAHPGLTPAQVTDTLKRRATMDVVTNSLSAENDLLYTLAREGSGGGGNSAPVSDFGYSCSELACSFTEQASDPDGDALDYVWDFGDGGTSTLANPDHTYASGGDYSVTLTVTDPDGASDDRTRVVSVSEDVIHLTVSGDRVQGRHTLYLSWTGASGAEVNIHRNGSLLVRTANDGEYTDATDNRGNGSYSYQVCETASDLCSRVVTFEF